MAACPRLILSRDALVHNWRTLAGLATGSTTAAAIKADGYGLGAREVLAVLSAAGCQNFLVAHWQEAKALLPLPEGVILAVLHGPAESDMAAALALPAGVRPVLNTPEQCARWRQTGRAADVMVDTGINRLGLDPAGGAPTGIAIATLHSHLACADTPDHPLNARQLAAFRALDWPAEARALANSAGIALGVDYHFDMVRPGIGLYGGSPSAGHTDLRPVAHLEAPVLQVRDVPAGAGIGYGASAIASRPSRIAIAALGYADGFPGAMAGHGTALVNGQRCPLIGRVSMDLTAFDVTDVPDLAEGDRLLVPLQLGAMAAATGRAEYELLTGLGRRYERCWQ
jgi:alanine racemase